MPNGSAHMAPWAGGVKKLPVFGTASLVRTAIAEAPAQTRDLPCR